MLDGHSTGNLSEEEDRRLASEVRALPDIPTTCMSGAIDRLDCGLDSTTGAKKIESGSAPSVTERLQARRLERHTTATREMRLELQAVQEQTATQIKDTAESCRAQLESDASTLAELMDPIMHDETLFPFDLPRLEETWDEVDLKLRQRTYSVEETVSSLRDIESERCLCVSELLQAHGRVLANIAYELQPGIERLLYSEAQAVNRALIKNRASIEDLRARLLTRELLLSRRLRAAWDNRRNVWCTLRQEDAVARLAGKVNSFDRYLAGREAALKALFSVDAAVCDQQRALATAASALAPNAIDDTELSLHVEEWQGKLQETLHLGNIERGRLLAELEEVAADSKGELEQMQIDCQIELVRSGACDAKAVKDLVESQVAAAVAKRVDTENQFNAIVKAAVVERAAVSEDHLSRLEGDLTALVRIWLDYCSERRRHEIDLDSTLENCRNTCAGERLELQQDLDTDIDRLRHSSSTEEMASYLDKIMGTMERTKSMWSEYQQRCVGFVTTYVERSTTALNTYSDSMRQHLQNEPFRSAREDQAQSESDLGCQSLVENSTSEENNQQYDSAAPDQAYDGCISQDDVDCGKIVVASIANELNAQQLLTDNGDISVIVETVLPKCYKGLADLWRPSDTNNDWIEHVNIFAEERIEEVNTEIDIFDHLHTEKVQRIKTDVLNVRRAELTLHRERVARHARALEQALENEVKKQDDIVSIIKSMSAKFLETFCAKFEKLPGAASTAVLKTMAEDMSVTANQFTADVRQLVRSFRAELNASLLSFRESNGSLRTSFLTFSEGGNFASAEIDNYGKVLHALADKIEETEGKILEVLNDLEGEQAALADEKVGAFNTRQEILLKDIGFSQSTRKLFKNVQMQVRSSVNECNTQCAAIDRAVSMFKDFDLNESSQIQVISAMRDIIAQTIERAALLGAVHPVALTKGSPDFSNYMTAPDSQQSRPSGSVRGRSGRAAKRAPKYQPQFATWDCNSNSLFMQRVHDLRLDCRDTSCADFAFPYYDSLHGRQILAPTTIVEENVQQFITALEDRLQQVFDRAQLYVDDCTKEFRDQVSNAIGAFQFAIPVLFHSAAGRVVQKYSASRELIISEHESFRQGWREAGDALLSELRPAHGHPQNSKELAELEARENARHEGVEAKMQSVHIMLHERNVAQSHEAYGALERLRADLFNVANEAVLPTDIASHGQTEHKNDDGRSGRNIVSFPAAESPSSLQPDSMKGLLRCAEGQDTELHNAIQSAYIAESSALAKVLDEFECYRSGEDPKQIVQDSKQQWIAAVRTLKSEFE